MIYGKSVDADSAQVMVFCMVVKQRMLAHRPKCVIEVDDQLPVLVTEFNKGYLMVAISHGTGIESIEYC